jgi:hypothetical protein
VGNFLKIGFRPGTLRYDAVFHVWSAEMTDGHDELRIIMASDEMYFSKKR